MPEDIFQNFIRSIFIFSDFSLCMDTVHCSFNPVIAYRHRAEGLDGVHLLSQASFICVHLCEQLYPAVANFFSESLNSSTGPDSIFEMKITKIKKFILLIVF